MRISNILGKFRRFVKSAFCGLKEFPSDYKEFGISVALVRLKKSMHLINRNEYIEAMTSFIHSEMESVIKEYEVLPMISKKTIDDQGSIPIWITWFQGEQYAPELCKACINNIRNMIPEGAKEVFLTKDNYLDYIDVPENILEKFSDGRIGMTNFTDIMRYYLLGTYGGAWIDSAIFLTNSVISKAFEHDVYTPKFCDENYTLEDASRGLWVQGCLFSKEPNLIFKFIYDCLISFWNNHDKAIEYLVCDYFMYNAYTNFDFAKATMDKIPLNSINKRLFNSKLDEEYSEKLWLELSNSSDIHLINRHLEYHKFTKDGKLTIYGYLLRSNGVNV